MGNYFLDRRQYFMTYPVQTSFPRYRPKYKGLAIYGPTYGRTDLRAKRNIETASQFKYIYIYIRVHKIIWTELYLICACYVTPSCLTLLLPGVFGSTFLCGLLDKFSIFNQFGSHTLRSSRRTSLKFSYTLTLIVLGAGKKHHFRKVLKTVPMFVQ